MIKNIRNFAIIAHVDHGKSTLADRLLEITNTVSKEKLEEQFLDQNPISRERGITIKLAPVRMLWRPKKENPKFEYRNTKQYKSTNDPNSKQESFKHLNFENSDLFRASDFGICDLDSEYILNLIDTPGHVDFSYEVSRTLACCEGVILLVDATQGIQAQTVAHLGAAKRENLVVVPVVNKIDLYNAQPEIVAKSLCETFNFNEKEIIYVSAKTGKNVELLLESVIKKIPPPKNSFDPHLKALVFDAVYDEHRGVVAFVRIVSGKVKAGDKIKLIQSKTLTQAGEVGFFSPFLNPSKSLSQGEIGYIITGIKNIRKCNVGDTIMLSDSFGGEDARPLPGYKQPKPMVFFGLYPKTTNDLIHLKEALDKLSLTDASLTVSEEHSAFLGNGFRVGFLGILHAEIVKERLKKEYGVEPLLTVPQVLYKRENDGSILEPYMNLTIYTPVSYVGTIMSVCQKRKGKFINIVYHDTYAILSYEIPFSMFIRGLSSDIKSASSGFASIDYELTDYKKADLVNLEIRVNDTPVDVLSELVYREDLFLQAREKVERLKKHLDKQQFRQVIQAYIGSKAIAREEIPPFRKDVIAKLSGGDRTRKDKLLKKQKKGKSRLFLASKVNLPQEALYSFLSEK